MKKKRFRTLAALSALTLLVAACGGGEDDADTDTGADEETEEPEEEEEEPEEDMEEEEEEEPEEDMEEEEDDGGDEGSASGLDCNTIEFMVPYAPGGGSDQQVRRLEPNLREILGADINIVYREGGAGAVAWQALKESEPDGCTVANVVYPNIVLAAMEDDGETFTPDEFTHLGQTETAPQALAVPIESEFEDIEQFIEAAEAAPGELTVGGSGQNGEVTNSQVADATGIDLSYVPMEGGVGDTIPLLVGGHVDAAFFSSSHIEANSDTIRALAIAGEERSDSENLADTPTFHELGYEGVDFATTWGVLGPPGMSDDVAQTWNDAVNEAVDDEMEQTLLEAGLTPMHQSLEEAEEFLQGVMDTFDFGG